MCSHADESAHAKRVDDYLAGLNRDPKSASYRKLKSNLGRLVNASPYLPRKASKRLKRRWEIPATVSDNVLDPAL